MNCAIEITSIENKGELCQQACLVTAYVDEVLGSYSVLYISRIFTYKKYIQKIYQQLSFSIPSSENFCILFK